MRPRRSPYDATRGLLFAPPRLRLGPPLLLGVAAVALVGILVLTNIS
jgi:hypothetical protein